MLKNGLSNILSSYTDQQKINSQFHFSLKTILNVFWLLCLSVLIYFFQIENTQRFPEVALILAGSFLLYVFIPLTYRRLFLIGLALAIEIYLIGVKLSLGVLIIIIYFTSLTYVNKSLLRTILVLISVGFCMLVFSKIVFVPIISNILMFGAMFIMLRYVYLLYELNYFKVKPGFTERISYLFLIPNSCFPLFPVIDPKDFINGFYSVPFNQTLERALNHITTGAIHLILYRIIYMYFSNSVYEIETFWQWLSFILSSYSLIFRLSGLFFTAVGFVELFGFTLPNVFDHVYFASGFADLWRRVNLYWRTFMMRVFYYPFTFKFKKWNQVPVLFFSINIMFAITWFLHVWQWYWIKGSFYLYATDVLFWGSLGFLISINSVIIYKRFARGVNPSQGKTNVVTDAAKIILMFILMSILWSLWTSSSLNEFLYLFRFSVKGNLSDYLLFFVGLSFVIITAAVIRWLYVKKQWFGFFFKDYNSLSGSVIAITIVVTGMFFKNTSYNNEVENFLSSNINDRDKNILERGYYDKILNNEEKSVELFNYNNKFVKWNVDNKAYRKVENELMKEFIPGYNTNFKGGELRTDSFGLRDKEYSLIKPANTTRYAFVGGSYVMGSGVSNGENFESILEKELNKSKNAVEILNFGTGGYHLIQSVYVTDHKVTRFQPDYLFYFIHSSDRERCLEDLVNLYQKNTGLTYSLLIEIIDKAKVNHDMCRLEIYNRLKPYINEIMIWGYGLIYNKCKEYNITPIMVYLPAKASLKQDNDKVFCVENAKKIGFYIIDLTSVYNGHKPKDIQLNLWDAHPNQKGHKIIADKLFEELMKKKDFINPKK